MQAKKGIPAPVGRNPNLFRQPQDLSCALLESPIDSHSKPHGHNMASGILKVSHL
jgi:hypothetical protein